jgi:3-isopropylmalate/(R)-2-methylmalate dehydratase small subunit
VIAASFARIFYRNAINMGLPILECPAAVAGTQTGQTLQVCLSQGTIVNLDTGQAFQAAPYPLFLMGIIEAGGLIPYTRRRMQEEGVL